MLCLHTEIDDDDKEEEKNANGRKKHWNCRLWNFLISAGTRTRLENSYFQFGFVVYLCSSVCAFCRNWSCYDGIFMLFCCFSNLSFFSLLSMFNFLKASLSQTPTSSHITTHWKRDYPTHNHAHTLDREKSKRQTSRSYACMFIGCLCFWPLITSRHDACARCSTWLLWVQASTHLATTNKQQQLEVKLQLCCRFRATTTAPPSLAGWMCSCFTRWPNRTENIRCRRHISNYMWSSHFTLYSLLFIPQLFLVDCSRRMNISLSLLLLLSCVVLCVGWFSLLCPLSNM